MLDFLKQKKKILIVDDDQVILDTLGFILKTEEYQVLKAKNSSDFFKAMKKNPDLILMDIHLEEIRGEELVHDANIENQVIFMSSDCENKDKYKLFMQKPLTPSCVKFHIKKYFTNLTNK